MNRISALKADTDIYTTFEGDNTVLMQLVAKNLLSEFKDKLKEMRPAQMAGFFIDQRLAAIAKRNPGFTLNLAESHLRDTRFSDGHASLSRVSRAPFGCPGVPTFNVQKAVGSLRCLCANATGID